MGAVALDKRWVEALDLVVGALDELPLRELQAACSLGRARFEAVEARRLAAEVGADGDTARARRLAGAGGARSKRAARAAAARAAAVSQNPGLADDLDAGALSDEQLDTIADAAADDASAATDKGFIDGIKKRTVDEGRKFARDRKNRSRVGESQAERQRRLRTARKYDDRAAGLTAITMAGDDATVDELWRLVRQRERQLREADGGRDLPQDEHGRTHEQRLFDALADLIRGTSSPVGRPSAVLVVPVDRPAHLAGGGPISDDVARDLLCRAGVAVELVDRLTGQPLWHARSRRNASDAQFLALVVRDEQCVLCGADWIGCEVHHLTPWNAPAQGETNIDDLALVCPDDHHHLHQAHLTLERLDDGTWKTRPATPDEIAPNRRPDRGWGARGTPRGSASPTAASGTGRRAGSGAGRRADRRGQQPSWPTTDEPPRPGLGHRPSGSPVDRRKQGDEPAGLSDDRNPQLRRRPNAGRRPGHSRRDKSSANAGDSDSGSSDPAGSDSAGSDSAGSDDFGD